MSYPVENSQVEMMLDHYVHPQNPMYPEQVAQVIANTFGPPQHPGSPAFQHYAAQRYRSWQHVMRFVAYHQMQHGKEVEKLIDAIRLLTEGGFLNPDFVTQTLLEAYRAYIPQSTECVNRLYGLGLALQTQGLMHMVEFPGLPQEPDGIFPESVMRR
ncbi:hypothetical protein F5Y15DRAFT_411284 [Xylariaceae sp. FL0016]|nr:hypothetical protein F5Y15DRAFT_411284 [Xylariaceae sp. FL0016]